MTITNDTGVAIGIVVALIASAVGATWVVANILNKLRAEIRGIRADVAGLRDEQYSISRAAEDAMRLALANPSLRVPDPRNPVLFIRVSGRANDE